MTGHDHDGEIAAFGVCRTCTRGRRTVTPGSLDAPAPRRKDATPAEIQAGRTANVRGQRLQALRLIAERDDGLTAYELSGLTGISPNQCGATLLSLREAECVAYVETDDLFAQRDRHGFLVRDTTPGNYGRVQVVTRVGLEALLHARLTGGANPG